MTQTTADAGRTESRKETELLEAIGANKRAFIRSQTRVGNLLKRGLVRWDHHPDRFGWYLTDAGRAALAAAKGAK